MKRFLKKRWHSIPIGIVAVLMALILVAGSAFAAYGFFTATAKVTVVEAIAVGAFDTWDNLEPYGSVNDVDIGLDVDGDGNPVITITTAADTPYVGEGFCPGEWIVIPLNIRNGSDEPLTLSASASGNLTLEHIWQTNNGAPDSDGCDFTFEASGTWEPLGEWNPTIAGNSGESGSAKVGAKVLFVKISVPEDAIPEIYTLTVTLYRG